MVDRTSVRTNNPAVNFQQLRSVRETVRRGFNLTEVAQALHTSQPGVSRQIRELEDELGIEIFMRAGKRLTGLTEPGRQVLPIVAQWVSRDYVAQQGHHDSRVVVTPGDQPPGERRRQQRDERGAERHVD